VIPAGVFLTGAIHLASNVNLRLEDGATLRFSQDPHDYLPVVFTRFESTECMNYSPFIYAFEQSNIAVTGNGTLDGGADADHWWPWKKNAVRGPQPASSDNRALLAQGEKDVPVSQRVYGDGSTLRPNFVQPYRSTNVLLEGVTIRNSPMWELNPVLCRNVTVRNVKISSHGPNNDGCDPECSTDVLIDGCEFDTGDDCIAIKSGRNRDGRRVNVPCENIVVRNCRMKDGHGGVSIGSEVSGGIRNVYMENNRMDSPHLDRALRIKTNSHRGGDLENFYFRNNTVGEVAGGVIDIDFYYEEGPAARSRPACATWWWRTLCPSAAAMRSTCADTKTPKSPASASPLRLQQRRPARRDRKRRITRTRRRLEKRQADGGEVAERARARTEPQANEPRPKGAVRLKTTHAPAAPSGHGSV